MRPFGIKHKVSETKCSSGPKSSAAFWAQQKSGGASIGFGRTCASSRGRSSGRESIKKRFKDLGIAETELEEKFIRSSGPGGQHLNKAATCVFLRHKPTGMEVKCQQQRSQSINRQLARIWLADKIEAAALRERQKDREAVEKARRQRRKRPRAFKEKILRNKKLQSDKKRLRAFRPGPDY